MMERPFSQILTASRGDMAYCAGCSHGLVLEHLNHAFERLHLLPEQVCIVSDIGCIGIADRYFACHTFHGLHGRSVTYAEGISRIRPEMHVVVLIGDGGCGIGTAHLVHAARRNARIKVVVCNNFNFGMTGGQHSPTCPDDACTPTAPAGTGEHPFDICGTLALNGAAFVARHSALDPACVDSIELALRTPGFAVLDLWELCVAYFVPANHLKPRGLLDLSERLGLPFGILHDRARPAPPRSNPLCPESPCDDARPPAPALPWLRRAEICIAGSAGQRIRSAAGTIGEIAARSGLHAAQSDDFPITVRKGHSISSLIISRWPIRYASIDRSDLVVLLSSDGAARVREMLATLDETALVVANRDIDLPSTSARVIRFDLAACEKLVGRASAALAALATGLVASDLTDPDALIAAAAASLVGPFRGEKLKSLESGVAALAQGLAIPVRTSEPPEPPHDS